MRRLLFPLAALAVLMAATIAPSAQTIETGEGTVAALPTGALNGVAVLDAQGDTGVACIPSQSP